MGGQAGSAAARRNRETARQVDEFPGPWTSCEKTDSPAWSVSPQLPTQRGKRAEADARAWSWSRSDEPLQAAEHTHKRDQESTNLPANGKQLREPPHLQPARQHKHHVGGPIRLWPAETVRLNCFDDATPYCKLYKQKGAG